MLLDGRIEYELIAPTGNAELFLVLAHPHPLYGGSMHNKVIDQLFRRSKERGWGVLRFNFRGVGKSTGTFDEGEGELEDYLSTLEHAVESSKASSPKFILVGYSFGAWVTFQALSRLKIIPDKVILIAPPVSMYEFENRETSAGELYVFAAEKDELIPLEKTKTWFDLLPEPKELHILEGADHYFIGQTTKLIKEIMTVIDEFQGWVSVGIFPLNFRNLQPISAQLLGPNFGYNGRYIDFMALTEFLQQKNIIYKVETVKDSLFSANQVFVPEPLAGEVRAFLENKA